MPPVNLNINGIQELDFPVGVGSATVAAGVATINLTGGGGGGSPVSPSISIGYNALPASLNVSTEGTADWLVFAGNTTLPDFQANWGTGTGGTNGTYRKRNGGLQIYGLGPVGTTALSTTAAFPSFALSSAANDARSTASALSFNLNGTTALFLPGANNNGFVFRVPCDTYQRILRVYVSNGSPYTVTCVSSDGTINHTESRASSNDQIVITYNGSSDGEEMTVFIGNDGAHTSNISIAVVTLAVSGTPQALLQSQMFLSPDSHPVSPNAANDEFEATSLDAKWTVQANTGVVQNINTTAFGSLYVKALASQTPSPVYSITQPLVPAAADFAVTAKCSAFPTANFHAVVLFLEDVVARTNAIQCGFGWDGGAVAIFMHKNVAGVQTNDIARVALTGNTQDTVYLHVQRVSGVYTYWYSFKGSAWTPLTITGAPAPTINLLGVEVASYSTTSPQFIGAVDFIRVNDFFL